MGRGAGRPSEERAIQSEKAIRGPGVEACCASLRKSKKISVAGMRLSEED